MKYQEQSFTDVLQDGLFLKFSKFHRKAPVLETLFDKIEDF